MSVQWTQPCVNKSATTLLEAISAGAKLDISLWQEQTTVQVYVFMIPQQNLSKCYAWCGVGEEKTYCVSQQTDIDECELKEVNDCQQHCNNTVGSFNCSCQEGFTLNTDGKNCDGRHNISLYWYHVNMRPGCSKWSTWSCFDHTSFWQNGWCKWT